MSVTSLSGAPSPTLKSIDTDAATTSKANDKPGKSSSSSSKASADAQKTKEKEELNKLLQTYKNEIQRGQSGSKLKLLAKQIAAAASALGQSVTLPSAPATAPTTTSAAGRDSSSKVNVTA